MATDIRNGKPLTIADVSQAIAAGRISYRVREGAYEITALDIRRMRRGDRRTHSAIAADLYLTPSEATSPL
jgi:hypothetical protein